MNYQEKVQALRQRHEALLQRKNQVVEGGNGIYEKYVYPILTAEHTPLEWNLQNQYQRRLKINKKKRSKKNASTSRRSNFS